MRSFAFQVLCYKEEMEINIRKWFYLRKTSVLNSSEKAQWEGGDLPHEAGDLSASPRTHLPWKESTPQSCPLISTCVSQ